MYIFSYIMDGPTKSYIFPVTLQTAIKMKWFLPK